MKIGVVVSGGGHLDQALELLDAFEGHDLFMITYRQKSLLQFNHPKIRRVYFVSLFGSRGILLWLSLIWNIAENLCILLKEKPAMLFSTGSEIAIAPFYLGRILFHIRLIYLETFCRVEKPSITAKVIYPVADLILVQWKSLLNFLGPKAKYEGRVF